MTIKGQSIFQWHASEYNATPKDFNELFATILKRAEELFLEKFLIQ